MKRLSAALLVSAALALAPANAALPPAADSTASPSPYFPSGYGIKSFGGLPGFAYSDPFNLTSGAPTWRPVPIAPVQLPDLGPVNSTTTGGNTPRSQAQRGLDAYSVLDFGAKCDGSTLDQTAIQAAMDAAASLGVALNIAPKGKTCQVQSVGYATGAKLRIDGTLAGNGTNSVLYNKFANGTSSAPEQNVVIEGDGTIDGRYTSQPASSACLLSIGAVQYLTVRNVTLKNCGNWPFNIVGNTGTPYAGAKHVYLSYVKAVGAYSFNSAEFQGCDDCWVDHYSSFSVAGDIAFAFYGNVTNSGITNSRLDGAAYGAANGIGVLSDGTPGQSITAFPCSDLLIANNIITNMSAVAISIATSTGVKHKNIKVIGNEGYGNNNKLTAAGGVAGLYVNNASNVESANNRFHNDGTGNASGNAPSSPVLGEYIDSSVDHFTSTSDAIVSEGSGGGLGQGVTIVPGSSYISFFSTIVNDSLPTGSASTSMQQAFNGQLCATCKIVNPNIDTSLPFGNITILAGAAVMGPTPWRTLSTTATCSGGGSLKTYTATIRYKLDNTKTLNFSAFLAITDIGTCALGVINLALPVPGASSGYFQHVIGREDVKTGAALDGQIASSGTGMSVLMLNTSGNYSTYTPVNGWQMDLSGLYETQ